MQILPVAQFYHLKLLTSSELKDLSNQHEARFSQSVFLAVRLVSIIGQVAVVVVVFLQTTAGVGNMMGKQLSGSEKACNRCGECACTSV